MAVELEATLSKLARPRHRALVAGVIAGGESTWAARPGAGELPNVPKPMRRRELLYALGFGERDPWAAVTESAYAELVREESPRRGPGSRMRYSSMGVGLLGDALAARAGMPYADLLAERVLAPLGMDATGIAVASPARLLTGHSRRGRPRPPIQDYMPAAGSLRSNTRDMLRFLAACLEPPATPLGRALELARRPQAHVSRRFELGLCWLIAKRARGGREIFWHNGGTWGFRSFAAFAPARGAAAVVMCNSAASVDRLGFRLIDAA